ncbi:class I SAM-dependent methyltransferase [Acidisoma sp. C75]
MPDMEEAAPANADQIAFWNEAGGDAWAAMQEQMDRQLAPLGDAMIAALAPRPGEAILDIGCGCGATSLSLAQAVGPAGRVLGADISQPMLDVARRRAAALSAPPSFQLADAQTADFGEARFDALSSRFGVMFFEAPEIAFANLRRTLKPGGRLAFVCWRKPAENPWLTTPLDAARPLLPPLPEPDPLAPGPFAFADPERVRRILSAAGFAEIDIAPHDTAIGSGSLDETLLLSTRIGPLARALRDHPSYREQVLGVVRAALAPYVTEAGVLMPAAVWLVRAKRD